ncbi:MAG: M20/M25/M40 family metallo-hydrolase, partial [Candidatus Gastranaerophilales bacterium]|nr:M20/M25/M40 family metallo-hydrolase [Candidatus Gastranaerophilales bacterium]
MKKKLIIVAFLFIFLCFITFLIYRTLIFVQKTPVSNIENKTTTSNVSAVENLSNALKHKVVTNKDITKNDYSNHDKFWIFLKETYPDVFNALKIEKIHNYNYLLKWEGKDRNLLPIMLTAHYDTVDVEEKTLKKWKYAPFQGEIAQDKVWGRGALDDRASFIAIFEAINNLIKNNYTPQRDIYFAFGHDEETGGFNGAVKIAEFLKEKNIKFDLILDEGGRVAKKKNGKQTAYVGISEKGRYLANITVENKAIHASRPYKESSITQLAKVIKVLNKNQMRAKITPQTKEYLEKTLDERDLITKILLANQDILKPLLIAKLSKNNLDNTIIRTTTAFTMLQGANSANAIPEIAQVTVDFR